MGVDEVFMFRSVEYKTQDVDDLTSTKMLKKLIRTNSFDLVLTGRSTFSNNVGCVGPTLTTLLGRHQLYYTCNLLKLTNNEPTVQCHANNRTMTFDIKSPHVLICDFTKFIRYLGLSNIISMLSEPMKAIPLPNLSIKSNPCIKTQELLVLNKPRKCKFFDDVNELVAIIFG